MCGAHMLSENAIAIAAANSKISGLGFENERLVVVVNHARITVAHLGGGFNLIAVKGQMV